MTNKKKVFITGGTGSVGQSLIESFNCPNYELYFQYNTDSLTADALVKKFNAISFQINFLENFQLPEIDFDIIINNLGINISDVVTHMVSETSWDETLLINLKVPFKIVKKYLPNMMTKKWGRIINISSIYGLRASEFNLPYTVSKHGISGITRTISKEYASYGITCNEICPAAIESKMMDRIASSAAKKEGISIDEYFNSVRNEIPAKRMANPCDVASLSFYLSSDEAGFINGASIPIDGGLIC
jgi:3-hydroxybutyrate dehydrogenase